MSAKLRKWKKPAVKKKIEFDNPKYTYASATCVDLVVSTCSPFGLKVWVIYTDYAFGITPVGWIIKYYQELLEQS